MIKCKNCGKINPNDSNFCQYCGSDNLLKVENEQKQPANNKNSIIKNIVIVILTIVLIVVSLLYVKQNKEIRAINDQLRTSEKESKELYDRIESYKTVTNKYDKIKKFIRNDFNDTLFAEKNILYKPYDAYVRIEFDYSGEYTLTFTADYGVSCEWYDNYDYDNISWLHISYSGNDVKNIRITNNVNSEIVNIIVFG